MKAHMIWFVRILILSVFIGISVGAPAVDTNLSKTQSSVAQMEVSQNITPTGKTQLFKADVSRIKIIGTQYDRIHLFLTDQAHQTYRISSLTNADAQNILERLKSEEQALVLSDVTQAKYKKYLDVGKWE